MDRKKEARGEAFKEKRFRRKNLEPKKPKEVESITEGVNLRPGYLHYQKSNQTRRQEKLGASQDKHVSN